MLVPLPTSRRRSLASFQLCIEIAKGRRVEVTRIGSLGMKRPLGSASKIVTLATSPMLSAIRGGGRGNTFRALALPRAS
jgi:hypothetical protein